MPYSLSSPVLLPFRLVATGLGERIAQARADAGLTQIDLAFALRKIDPRLKGTDPGRISEWENEKRPRIPFYAVVGIAQVTKKPLTFFGDTDANGDPESLTRDTLERLGRLASELEKRGQIGEAAGLRGVAETIRRLAGEQPGA